MVLKKDPEDPRSDEDMQAQHAADDFWARTRPIDHNAPWRDLPPTHKQLYFLKKHNVLAPGKTRGECAKQIDEVLAGLPEERAQREREAAWRRFRDGAR